MVRIKHKAVSAVRTQNGVGQGFVVIMNAARSGPRYGLMTKKDLENDELSDFLTVRESHRGILTPRC